MYGDEKREFLFGYCGPKGLTSGLFFVDPPNGEEWKALDDGLAYGADMVKHIRSQFGDSFTICVAGKLDSVGAIQLWGREGADRREGEGEGGLVTR